MKSTDVYREIRKVIGPWCKANDFQKGPGGMLCYVKPQANRFVVFWFQCAQGGGWNAYAGSEFVVEFQFSKLNRPGAFGDDCKRDRLPHFLNKADLEKVRQMQNEVINKLPRPPDDYFLLHDTESLRNWFLNKFKPVENPYRRTDDIWLRYHDEEDVIRWSEFVLEVLPNVLGKLTA